MEEISGVVERVTYTDEEKGFSVIKIKANGYRNLVTVVGNISNINVGSVITAKGNFTTNKKFGKQFSVTSWEETLPSDVYGIEKYLGSGLIKGVGPKFAKLIVETFGTDTLSILEHNPERLLEIPKLGKKKAESIAKSYSEQRDVKNLMMFLSSAGISTSLGQKIFKVYGKESIEKIKENPYRLMDEVYGVGFKTADSIAEKLGIDNESFTRCRAGIFYTLEYLANSEGHCYVPFDEMVLKCSKILGIEDSKVVITYDSLIKNNELIVEDKNKVYLPSFFRAEIGLTKKIKDIISYPNFKKVPDEKLESEIKNAEKLNKIKYDDFQKEAIKTVFNSNFSVVTGGPGVGKTTITKGIIEIFKNLGKKVLLAAPTGRAAKRLSETAKTEAKTIHRLLEIKREGGFAKNAENKLSGDVLIVDEASMIDLILMHNLLKAVHSNTKIILIGDVNQLPSVGPGNVLKDIINSGAVPVVKLQKIYRQAKTSNIILNSHKINSGKIPELKASKNSDFFFIEENDDEKCADLIVDLYSKRLPKYYKVNSISDIEVLTPMKKGILGTDNLNKVLQEKLNKTGVSLKRGGITYKLNDKVMQIKNNYDKDVFNGDIGKICSINEANETLEINFDSRILKYEIGELEEITLAYACTIHKSQGSEYPIVIIPMTTSHFIMLKRNLLYTGVTRGKKVCILVGNKYAISKAISNNESEKRYTLLEQRLSF
ncbi:MAG: ATP-dependent RecD-like DNA helicase [Clostridia bacterium]|nr:ATP-dependent RecD-like DNA helicase [Clostridia bacterium]